MSKEFGDKKQSNGVPAVVSPGSAAGSPGF